MYILLTGYKRSGKDTVAEMLYQRLQEYDIPVVHESLADPLKQIAYIVSGGDTNGHREEVVGWGYSPRQLWQWLGTEVFQKAICKRFPLFAKRTGRLIWCKLLYRRTSFNRAINIISDCRFPHEVEFFKTCGAIVVRVNRYNIPWYKRIFLHESERHVPKLPVDYIIDNTGTIKDLEVYVEALASRIAYDAGYKPKGSEV